MSTANFSNLTEFLKKIPSIRPMIASGNYENQTWWVKFSIDINHTLAWNVVQELGHVINYVSLNEQLPAKFYPVSAPPYMNGGPSDFLFWIIESDQIDFTPDNMKEWLEGRLPDPIDDIREWSIEDEE